MNYKEKYNRVLEDFQIQKGLYEETERKPYDLLGSFYELAYNRGLSEALKLDEPFLFRNFDEDKDQAIRELRHLLELQRVPDVATFSMIKDIAHVVPDKLLRYMDIYNFGLITGKKLERAKHKGGKINA